MADEDHLEIFKKGVRYWNRWREAHPSIKPDLDEVNLNDKKLDGINLSGTSLRRSNLLRAKLRAAHFRGADLLEADLSEVDLGGAELRGADLINATLYAATLNGADFSWANLSGANLQHTDLRAVTFNNTILTEANLSKSRMDSATFGDVDLSVVKGLERIAHTGPSTIGIDTLYRSGGDIPREFLLGCGLPENFIPFLKSHIGAEEAIQFYSCFISYSHKDEEFARRLHSRMRQANLRVWYAPDDIRGGQKLHEQIDRAIQIHDRLLLVLSENSLKSEWVVTEIRKARKTEIAEKRHKLFPIRLIDFDLIREWECFDADSGKDLAVEVREYFIPDFSNWKDHDSFESAFDSLMNDLRLAENQSEST